MELQPKHANEHLHKAHTWKLKRWLPLWGKHLLSTPNLAFVEVQVLFFSSDYLYRQPTPSLIMNLKCGMKHDAGSTLTVQLIYWSDNTHLCVVELCLHVQRLQNLIKNRLQTETLPFSHTACLFSRKEWPCIQNGTQQVVETKFWRRQLKIRTCRAGIVISFTLA